MFRSSRVESRPVVPEPHGSGVFGTIVLVAGILIAAWTVAGRVLFGISGPLVLIFAFTLGPLLVLVFIYTGLKINRAHRRGHSLRPGLIVCLIAAWFTGLLFGFTVPDATPEGLQSIIANSSNPWLLEMSIAFCNPAGILCAATAIGALAFAHVSARGPVLVDED